MNLLQRVEHWGDAHHPKWLDLLRIVFGLFLLFKGVEFANNMNGLMNLLSGQAYFGSFMLMILAHFVLGAHILGGVLLTVGLLTRFACLIQIPVLIGAIIFVNTHNVFRQFSELSLSFLVLLLLVYFLIIGSGRWSLDWYMDKEK
jgi:putative oxidoreductase